MRKYELAYLISADVSEEETKALQSKIIGFVQDEGGVLDNEGAILKRKLAYPIKKQTLAYLGVLFFQVEPEKLANLEKKLKMESLILRFLLLIKPVFKESKLSRRRVAPRIGVQQPFVSEEEKKVELKEIEKKLEEILKE